jgi:hypothetical protein
MTRVLEVICLIRGQCIRNEVNHSVQIKHGHFPKASYASLLFCHYLRVWRPHLLTPFLQHPSSRRLLVTPSVSVILLSPSLVQEAGYRTSVMTPRTRMKKLTVTTQRIFVTLEHGHAMTLLTTATSDPMTVQSYPKIGIGIDDYHQTESRDSIEQTTF